MKKIKVKCVVCNSEYEILCPTCAGAASQPSWKRIFCSESCQDIYHACVRYERNAISAEDAKNVLIKHNLNKIDNFIPLVKKVVADVCKVEKQEQVVETATEDSIVLDTNTSKEILKIVEEAKENTVVSTPSKPLVYNKKMHKKSNR